MKNKPDWGNHFGPRGYCVDIVGLDNEIVRNYIKYQDKQDQRYD